MRIVLLILAVIVAALPALAHSWYPVACCGNLDCFPVACDQLVETISGWLYVPTGNLFTRKPGPTQSRSSLPCVCRTRPRSPLDLCVHRAERLGAGAHR